MRRTMVFFVMSVALNGCARGAAPPVEFSPADSMSVRTAFDSLYAAINRLDVEATLAAYDSSSAFAHVFDGNLVRGRAAYDGMIRAIFPTVKGIENAAIDSSYVVPAGADAAIHVSAFHETVIDASGGRTTERGMWSNVFVRRPTGWKVVYGHTTQVVLSSTK